MASIPVGATGDPIHFMFGSMVEFLGSEFSVGGRPPSWIISNGHISAMAHSIHLHSAHRAVIFAIAQLSCLNLVLQQDTGVMHISYFLSHGKPTAVSLGVSLYNVSLMRGTAYTIRFRNK